MTRRVLFVVLGAAAVLAALATPAGAHGVGGIEPTNYESTFTRMEPRLRGVTLEVLDLGATLRLTNTGGRDVVVLGYKGEPYLRVGPRGVFENRRSPATFLNRSRTLRRTPPASADATAPPEWRRVSGGDVASWHDHRVHFMGGRNPPVVRDDPGHRHVVDRWTVGLRTGDRDVVARGTLVWVPPPSPWAFIALAAIVAGSVIVLSRTRAWRQVLVAALAGLLVCASVHALGLWNATTASTATKLAESGYSIAGIVLGLITLAWMWRRGVEASTPFVLVDAIFLLVAGGLADLATLGHSQVPSTIPAAGMRIVIALTLGLGTGLAVAAALRLRLTTLPPVDPTANPTGDLGVVGPARVTS